MSPNRISAGVTVDPQESTKHISFLSGSDAVRILELIQNSLSCICESDFAALFPKVGELFQFDFAGVLLGGIREGSDLDIVHALNISFPEEWLRQYLSHNYFHSDFATKETFRTFRLNHWSYLTTPDVDKVVPKEVMALNMDIGAREGYFHGSPPAAPGRHGSSFCFAGAAIKRDSRSDAIVEILIHHLHLAFSRICDSRPSSINPPVISPREREVLNWLKQGKSSWEMSVILDISERTVNYHIYNIMEKLNAVNRPQAVAIATHMSLIALD